MPLSSLRIHKALVRRMGVVVGITTAEADTLPASVDLCYREHSYALPTIMLLA